MCRANCYGGSCQHSHVSEVSRVPCKACWNEEMEAADERDEAKKDWNARADDIDLIRYQTCKAERNFL